MTVGEWNQIEAAFAAFGLIVFRDQILTESEHLDFARRWGPIDTHPPEPKRGVWHNEGSYLGEPPLGAIEVARELPADGETIIFANTYEAFDTLSTTTQKALEALRAVHSSTTHGATNNAEADEHQHPIVIHHPVSGRKTLYVNPTFTTSVEDMDERVGLALLNQLYDHCQQPEFTTAIEWEMGMVILSDSRATLRFSPITNASSGISRVTVAGARLLPAIAPAKKDPTLTQRAGATLAGGILTAAMTGIAEVIDPERVQHEIEIVSEAPEPDDLPEFDFGELPPLD